jgi:hypothetical protein
MSASKIAQRVVARFLSVAMEHDSPEALKKYLHDHPGANKSKHHVKQEKGKDEPKKDEPKKDEGKKEFPEGAKPLGQDGARVYEDFTDLIGRTDIDKDKLEWDFPALDVVLARMKDKEPVTKDEAKDALDDYDKLASEYEDENLISWRNADRFRAKLTELFKSL